MELYVLIMELIGTIAFAISGAIVGIKKKMDIFGVAILGVVTACGGGLLRDTILGNLPPLMFRNPIYLVTSVITALLIFIIVYFNISIIDNKAFEQFLLISDSIGLGIFTVSGIAAVIENGYADNFIFTIFLGALTGVGGGVFRDIFSDNAPYIFVKHIYACASIIGAISAYLLWNIIGKNISMAAGCIIIFIIRILAAKFEWSLPKIKSKNI